MKSHKVFPTYVMSHSVIHTTQFVRKTEVNTRRRPFFSTLVVRDKKLNKERSIKVY